MGKREGKMPIGRSRRKWEYNTKMDLTDVAWVMDWIHLNLEGKVVGFFERRN
jgi:hypothetical protein